VGRCDRGVKRASLWVLWRTYMPSVLTEIGYLTNPEEEHFLGSEKGQNFIASGLFRAFRQYKDDLEGVSRTYNDAFEKQGAYSFSKEDSAIIKQNKEEPLKEPENKNNEKGTVVKTPEEKKGKPVDSFPVTELPIKTEVKPPQNVSTSTTTVKAENANTIKVPLQKDSIKTAYSKNAAAAAIIYKVQITSSAKAIPVDAPVFDGIEKVGSYMEGKEYKYTAGEFTDLKKVTEYKELMRKKGFKDCFVIATQNGKRVPLK